MVGGEGGVMRVLKNCGVTSKQIGLEEISLFFELRLCDEIGDSEISFFFDVVGRDWSSEGIFLLLLRRTSERKSTSAPLGCLCLVSLEE